MAQKIELKPCPFCGEKDNIEVFVKYDDCFIACTKCCANGPYKHTEEEAVEAWNTRYQENVVKIEVPTFDAEKLVKEAIRQMKGGVIDADCSNSNIDTQDLP